MNGKQLKNSILQLAIQGKLVPQDPNDEPASELLKRIQKEKDQLVKEGKLKKKDLVTSPIDDDEKPFDLPQGWSWCRLGELGIYKKGPFGSALTKSMFVPRGDNSIKVYEQKNAIQKDYKLGDYYITKAYYEKMKGFEVHPKDIIVSCAGTIGETYVIPEGAPLGIINQALMRVQLINLDITDYWILYFKYILLKSETIKGNGSAIKNIPPFDIFKNYVVALPPLAEQQRIVAKIEELMPWVDEYDKAQTQLDNLNNNINDALCKSVLQEAIMGKLVPQDPSDEPALELLKRIQNEKEQLVKSGKLKKKDLASSSIKEDEKPFKIPKTWEWVRLGDLGIFERGNGIKRDETILKGLPCVRYGEMYTKYRYSSTFKETVSFTSKSVYDKCRKAHKGDIFMALTGENKEDVALAAQYIGNDEIAVGGDLCHFSIIHAFALFFVYVINSPYYIEQKKSLATGDIIVHISADKLGSISIPLPPLAEQHRIVAKIEEIFSYINK